MPSSSVTVSVVIPAFDAAETIADTIQSVLAQRHPGEIEVEIIVADDASTDGTIGVVVAISDRHPDVIRLVRLPVNAGPAAARNAGFRAATGALICFLDADDEYVPGFFRAAARSLADQPSVAAIVTGLTLLNMHRDIHRLQLDDIRNSLPSNVLLRRPIMDLIGGFPEHPIFRGECGGEDEAFKRALLDNFMVLHVDDAFLRHRVRRGGHLDRYLDSTAIVGEERVFIHMPPEQADGSLPAAIEAFSNSVAERLRCAERTRIPTAFDVNGSVGVEAYEQLRNKFECLPGSLPPVSGFALYRAAAFGPGSGYVALRARLPERATAWLEAGTKSTSRRRIIAHPVAGEPIRLLVIDLELENWRAAFHGLATRIVKSGCVAFDGIRDEHDVEVVHAELLRAHLFWSEIGRVGRLRVYTKD
jgi:hypothetical protein